jgi:hypothetical protein
MPYALKILKKDLTSASCLSPFSVKYSYKWRKFPEKFPSWLFPIPKRDITVGDFLTQEGYSCLDLLFLVEYVPARKPQNIFKVWQHVPYHLRWLEKLTSEQALESVLTHKDEFDLGATHLVEINGPFGKKVKLLKKIDYSDYILKTLRAYENH